MMASISTVSSSEDDGSRKSPAEKDEAAQCLEHTGALKVKETNISSLKTRQDDDDGDDDDAIDAPNTVDAAAAPTTEHADKRTSSVSSTLLTEVVADKRKLTYSYPPNVALAVAQENETVASEFDGNSKKSVKEKEVTTPSSRPRGEAARKRPVTAAVAAEAVQTPLSSRSTGRPARKIVKSEKRTSLPPSSVLILPPHGLTPKAFLPTTSSSATSTIAGRTSTPPMTASKNRPNVAETPKSHSRTSASRGVFPKVRHRQLSTVVERASPATRTSTTESSSSSSSRDLKGKEHLKVVSCGSHLVLGSSPEATVRSPSSIERLDTAKLAVTPASAVDRPCVPSSFSSASRDACRSSSGLTGGTYVPRTFVMVRKGKKASSSAINARRVARSPTKQETTTSSYSADAKSTALFNPSSTCSSRSSVRSMSKRLFAGTHVLAKSKQTGKKSVASVLSAQEALESSADLVFLGCSTSSSSSRARSPGGKIVTASSLVESTFKVPHESPQKHRDRGQTASSSSSSPPSSAKPSNQFVQSSSNGQQTSVSPAMLALRRYSSESTESTVTPPHWQSDLEVDPELDHLEQLNTMILFMLRSCEAVAKENLSPADFRRVSRELFAGLFSKCQGNNNDYNSGDELLADIELVKKRYEKLDDESFVPYHHQDQNQQNLQKSPKTAKLSKNSIIAILKQVDLIYDHCKQDLDTSLYCIDCVYLYYRHSGDSSFCYPCARPHALVWCKFDTSNPWWPAKVVGFNEANSKVRLKFFGDLTRLELKVSSQKIYRLTEHYKWPAFKHKTSNSKKLFVEAMAQLDVHVAKLKEMFGESKVLYATGLKSLDIEHLYLRDVSDSVPQATDSVSTVNSPSSSDVITIASSDVNDDDDYQSCTSDFIATETTAAKGDGLVGESVEKSTDDDQLSKKPADCSAFGGTDKDPEGTANCSCVMCSKTPPKAPKVLETAAVEEEPFERVEKLKEKVTESAVKSRNHWKKELLQKTDFNVPSQAACAPGAAINSTSFLPERSSPPSVSQTAKRSKYISQIQEALKLQNTKSEWAKTDDISDKLSLMVDSVAKGKCSSTNAIVVCSVGSAAAAATAGDKDNRQTALRTPSRRRSPRRAVACTTHQQQKKFEKNSLSASSAAVAKVDYKAKSTATTTDSRCSTATGSSAPSVPQAEKGAVAAVVVVASKENRPPPIKVAAEKPLNQEKETATAAAVAGSTAINNQETPKTKSRERQKSYLALTREKKLSLENTNESHVVNCPTPAVQTARVQEEAAPASAAAVEQLFQVADAALAAAQVVLSGQLVGNETVTPSHEAQEDLGVREVECFDVGSSSSTEIETIADEEGGDGDGDVEPAAMEVGEADELTADSEAAADENMSMFSYWSEFAPDDKLDLPQLLGDENNVLKINLEPYVENLDIVTLGDVRRETTMQPIIELVPHDHPTLARAVGMGDEMKAMAKDKVVPEKEPVTKEDWLAKVDRMRLELALLPQVNRLRSLMLDARHKRELGHYHDLEERRMDNFRQRLCATNKHQHPQLKRMCATHEAEIIEAKKFAWCLVCRERAVESETLDYDKGHFCSSKCRREWDIIKCRHLVLPI